MIRVCAICGDDLPEDAPDIICEQCDNTCELCGGDGIIELNDQFPRPDGIPYHKICPVCHGTGAKSGVDILPDDPPVIQATDLLWI